ncbi:UDP-glycosyltransferase UGT39B2 [Danaus plexippus plexippus]|uniref:UDP-glucuronosyltransferase n=1 Tax=Danaus plexippus plexippus TaxID=278856 RepID=A0A212EHV3_DANPL|nr:UDP-glucuronosyltransferase-like isoform X1 [Danaus plexippus plexippus]OWR41057.1 UDP-glycosyltransferase UGT39B2 [Danaus plexippus plexippus]
MANLHPVLFLIFLTKLSDSANILYVMPFSATSHYIMLKPIGTELARRGHNVTVITSIRDNNPPPNYHQILVNDTKIWDLLGIERPVVFSMVDLSTEELYNKIVWPGLIAFTELTFKSREFMTFLKKDNAFDLVISEQFYHEALYALAYKYNAPLALVTTFGNCMRHNYITRNPLQMATVTSELLVVEDPTSFWGRLRNLLFNVYDYTFWRYWYLEEQEKLVRKYLPELTGKVPSLYEMQKETALMLINSHFSYDTPAAILPNIVEIGGLHFTKSNLSLPEDLQKVLDEAQEGVVYVNFGSNVRSIELPVEKKNAFLNVFRQLKQTVLWKWEDDVLDDKPSNLFTRKWFPQKDILQHPNIKVFVSHGGLIGMQEAIINGVPVVGVPVFGDQFNNVLLAQEAGFGKLLRYHDINEKTLSAVLNEVLYNASYMETAKEVSRRFLDRPLSPMDTAIYWLEYVIRNKGAEYLKNPARNLSWIAYNMLDVYSFIAIILIVIMCVFIKSWFCIKASITFKQISKSKKQS